MTSRTPNPLLRVDDRVEWAEFNRATPQQRLAWSMGLTPSQRVEVGQRLSQEAFAPLAAAIRDGRVPRRVLWDDDLMEHEVSRGALSVG
jgi:hypothetical protein